MHRTLFILINILIVLGLIVPIEIDEIAAPPGQRAASALAAGASSVETGDPSELTKRAKVKKKRRQDRRDKRQKERKNDRDKKGKGKKNRRQNRREAQELPSGRLPAAQRLAGADGQPNIEDHYIVVLADNAGDAQRTATDLENDTGDIVPTYIYEDIFDGFAAIIPDGSLETVRNDPRVEEVIPDRVVQLSAQTLPTGIDRIDADTNPTAGINRDGGNVDVDVAVLDTAGSVAHPDLNVFRATQCR